MIVELYGPPPAASTISQTLYLVAAELGLGASVTCAVNSAAIDDVLDLDSTSEGTIAVVGLGLRVDGRSPRESSLGSRLFSSAA